MIDETKKSRLFCVYWLPVIIYCVLIFVQSSFPATEKIPPLPHMDKLLHAACYAVLGALFLRAFMTSRIKSIKMIMLASILSASLYGISDECHQYFVPSRNADFADAAADMIGSACGVFVCRFFLKQ